jgi:hypothetical protein
MTIEEIPTPYQEKFVRCTEKIQGDLVKSLQSNLDASLTSSDQMGCCIIAITNLIRDLSGVIASGTEKSFTFDDFIAQLVGMNQHMNQDEK